MAKKESTLINMVLTLLIITVISGGALGMVYKVTKEPIALSKLKKQKAAINEVVPGFDNDPTSEQVTIKSKDGLDLTIFPCKKGGETIGAAVSSITQKGFGGTVRIMVGLKPDGTILNYSVLEMAETPGLGSKMTDWFKDDAKPSASIVGKNPTTTKMIVSKDGGDIDAITAATISSRAFLDAVNRAYETYMDYVKGATTESSTIKENENESAE